MTAGATALGDVGEGGFSPLGELVLFWVPAPMPGLASSGVCSLGISGAEDFCRKYKHTVTNQGVLFTCM